MGVDDCQRVPGLKCLLLRKVGKSITEQFEDLRKKLFPRLPHEFAASRGELTFANGSRIRTGHFQNEKDIDAYLGLEYDVIGVEEATTLTSRKYSDISTCCRTSKPNWRPRIYSTTNPGGVGHAWYRARFVAPYQQQKETETRFIPARVVDNQFINAKYRTTLERLTGWKKRAWLFGDWDIAAGQFFTPFRREAHVLSKFDEGRGIEWFASMDYGFTHPTVVLLGCKDSDGNIYIVDEHVERLWLPQRHAPCIKAMFERHGVSYNIPKASAAERERRSVGFNGDILDPQRMPCIYPPRFFHRRWKSLARFVAGSAVFSKQSDGTTIAMQYKKLGISMRSANMDRINGWAEILHRLGDPDNGIAPTLFIHERCARLLECLPSLQHDPNRPEDVLKVDLDEDGQGGDDTADALRYLVCTKPRIIHEMRLTGW